MFSAAMIDDTPKVEDHRDRSAFANFLSKDRGERVPVNLLTLVDMEKRSEPSHPELGLSQVRDSGTLLAPIDHNSTSIFDDLLFVDDEITSIGNATYDAPVGSRGADSTGSQRRELDSTFNGLSDDRFVLEFGVAVPTQELLDNPLDRDGPQTWPPAPTDETRADDEPQTWPPEPARDPKEGDGPQTWPPAAIGDEKVGKPQTWPPEPSGSAEGRSGPQSCPLGTKDRDDGDDDPLTWPPEPLWADKDAEHPQTWPPAPTGDEEGEVPQTWPPEPSGGTKNSGGPQTWPPELPAVNKDANTPQTWPPETANDAFLLTASSDHPRWATPTLNDVLQVYLTDYVEVVASACMMSVPDLIPYGIESGNGATLSTTDPWH